MVWKTTLFFWSSAGVGGVENKAVPLGHLWLSTQWTRCRLPVQSDPRFPWAEMQRNKWSCPVLHPTQSLFISVRDTQWLLPRKPLLPLKLLLQCPCPLRHGWALTGQYISSFKTWNHRFAVFSLPFVQRYCLAGFLRQSEHKDVARKHRPRSRP